MEEDRGRGGANGGRLTEDWVFLGPILVGVGFIGGSVEGRAPGLVLEEVGVASILSASSSRALWSVWDSSSFTFVGAGFLLSELCAKIKIGARGPNAHNAKTWCAGCHSIDVTGSANPKLAPT